MSWQATAWAVTQRTGHPTAKVLLLVLSETADRNGYTFPKVSRLAEDCEVSADTVRRGIARLVEGGFITVHERFRPDGSQTSNGYRLLLPGIDPKGRPECDEDETPPLAICEGGHAATGGEGVAPVRPHEPTSINHHDSLSSSGSPQKKGRRAKASKSRPSRWTDKPLADRMGPNGVPFGADGSEDWPAMVFEVQFVDLAALARRNSSKPVSDGSIRARLGKLIKEHGAFEASKRIAQCLKTGPGGDPLTYIEGVKRAERDDEQRARDAMRAPIDYR